MRHEDHSQDLHDEPVDTQPMDPPFDPEEPPPAEPIQLSPLSTTSPTLNLPTLTSEPIDEDVTPTATLITAPLKGDDWEFTLPREAIQARIQEDLASLGRYKGKQSGRWGNLSVYAIGEIVGYPVAAPDRELCVRIQEYAAELSGISHPEESKGYLSEEDWEDFVTALESSE